jgi:hypothetical protein
MFAVNGCRKRISFSTSVVAAAVAVATVTVVMLRHFRNKHGTSQPYPKNHHAYPPLPPKYHQYRHTSSQGVIVYIHPTTAVSITISMASLLGKVLSQLTQNMMTNHRR